MGRFSGVALLAPFPMALLIAATIESLKMPWQELPNSFSAPVVFLQSVSLQIQGLFLRVPVVPVCLLLACVVLLLAARWRGRCQQVTAVVLLGLSALLSSSLYLILVEYAPFGGYVPFMICAVLFALFLFSLFLSIAHDEQGRVSWWVRLFLLLCSVIGAAGAFYIDIFLFVRLYPSLHETVSGLLVVFVCVLLLLVVGFLPERLRGHAALTWVAVVGWAALIAVVVFEQAHGLPRELEPHIATFTNHGRYAVESYRERSMERACTSAPAPMDPERASALFEEHSGLPDLPADFSVTDYNVLLISIETTRFDQTSLAEAGPPGTTPFLEGLVERGAFVFSRAYTSAPNTFRAMLSLFHMSHASMTPATCGEKHWCGALDPEAPTIGQLFAEAGYDTFQVRWGEPGGCLQGIDKGIRSSSFVEEIRGVPDEHILIDRKIADLVIENLDRAAGSDDRFFGWVFLLSPHEPYLTTEPGDWSDLEAYRQCVGYADRQIGRIVTALAERGLEDDTIVIIHGDHGEEFGDHGGHHHGQSLFEELTHVPLVVHIPSSQGRRVETPTSLVYVFPWLMATGNALMRDAVMTRIQEDIAPMMHATRGAIVSELLDPNRMLVSMVSGDTKLIHNFTTGLTRVFDLRRDPGERENLYAPHVLSPAQYKAIDAYLELLACR